MENRGMFPVERNRYYNGKPLNVDEFETEQFYNRNQRKMDRHLFHGTGVIRGMGVSMIDESTLLIGSGAALDNLGNAIVIPDPMMRRLPMLEGYRAISGRSSAWLCLEYAEEEAEPVNTVRSLNGQSEAFNKIREGYRLYLTAETPDYGRVMDSEGTRTVSVLYASEELSVILAVPKIVCCAEEFQADLLVVKTADIGAVTLELQGSSPLIECENDWLKLSYIESPEDPRQLNLQHFRITPRSLSSMQGELFPDGAELFISYGSRQYRNYIKARISMRFCQDMDSYRSAVRKNENVNFCSEDRAVPIYLAKLELKNGSETYLRATRELPFGQFIRNTDSGTEIFGEDIRVKTTIRQLEYWQTPEVNADYYHSTGTLRFDFGIPSPELHDYKISHGIVDLELPGGLRVNSRKISEEIPHGLGPGNVDIRLSIECRDEKNETMQLIGNSEVFKARGMQMNLPWAETAVVVYPERGTMRIGLWLHDTVPGNVVRIHYFAQKPEYDTDRLFSQKKAEIRIIPEVNRVLRGEKLSMKAVITGLEDKNIHWSIKDHDGGIIGVNGLYEAPMTPGTYEILAAAAADEKICASAFVIVE